uniref:Sugar transporter SWEET n=1 Tax=Plectus sambesii TaxID=2011161 RepID=A0A914WUA3_9BILA
MDFVSLYTTWLTLFTICFSFFPIFMVLEWRKRGTSEGFSSINLVLPIMMMGCWLRYGFLTNDKSNITINSVNIGLMSCYLLAFAYYQPNRTNVKYQVVSVLAALAAIYAYVATVPADKAADTMGGIAAGTQILGLGGAIYEITRIIGFKHTEYVPANMTFGMTLLATQWLIFGLLINDFYVTIANVAGLAVNVVTILMYVIYPPLTWRVPLLGVGPQEKKKQ